METGAGASARVCRAEHSGTQEPVSSQSEASIVTSWPMRGRDSSRLRCYLPGRVCECALTGAPHCHLLSLISDVSHQKLTQELMAVASERRVGQFYLYVYPNLSWIPAKIRENVRGFIWKFLKLLDKPGPLPWLSSRFIISIKLTTTHFNNLVKTPASMARIENAKLTTFKIIQLEAR